VRSFFTHYEVVSVKGRPLVYMNRKAILLTLNQVTEHKAQIQMMSIHNKQLTKFEEQQKLRAMNDLSNNEEKSAADTGSITESLTKALGHSNLMLNNLH